MEKLFTFYVAIPGTGKTVDEAWASAQESFVQSNITTPEVVGTETSPDAVIMAGLEKAGACAIDMGTPGDANAETDMPIVETLIKKNENLLHRIGGFDTHPAGRSILLVVEYLEEVAQLQAGILALIRNAPRGGFIP